MGRHPAFRAALILALAAASPADAVVGPLFQGLGDLSGGTVRSEPFGVSDDGSVVAGFSNSSNGDEAFRWTAAGGIQGLGNLGTTPFDSRANAISGDGTTIVGRVRIANSGTGAAQYNAFKWTSAGGMVSLGELPGGVVSSTGYAVSGDGSVIAGSTSTSNGLESFRWTSAAGMQALPTQLPALATDNLAQGMTSDANTIVGASRSTGYNLHQAYSYSAANGAAGLGDLVGGDTASWARAVSDNGAVVIGYSGSTASGTSDEAFRWTSGTGMTGLGDLPGGSFFSQAWDCNVDGTVVGGTGFGEAFIWDAANGMRRVQDILTSKGVNLTGWTLGAARAITPDGNTIVGTGINPSGNQEAWIATIIPEPTGMSLLLPLAASISRRNRRGARSRCGDLCGARQSR